MSKSTVLLPLFLLSLLCTATCIQPASAQGLVQGGTRYMVAFMPVTPEQTEKPMAQPLVIEIVSRTPGEVVIATPAVINGRAKINLKYTLKANTPLKVPVDLSYMVDEHGIRDGAGIEISATVPITVVTSAFWLGNGEQVQHIPVSSWGTEYRTVNMYSDVYGAKAVGYRYRPSNVVLIADKDNTIVDLYSALPFKDGLDLDTVGVDRYRVTLQRGEAIDLDWAIDTALVKSWESDPSGTRIVSSQPIAVLSGSRKTAVMRMPSDLPPTGMFRSQAHFVRNCLQEAVYPTSFAGKEFVTIPFLYTPTRVTGQGNAEWGVDNDRGDVIRITAVETNTTVYKKRQDGSGEVSVAFIEVGESYLDTACETATFWRTSKPVQVFQYAKSYAKLLPPGIGKVGDSPEGHPTVEAGMPSLTSVAPKNRWITHATFSSGEGVDNFMNIVFKKDEVTKIMFDGRRLDSLFGGSMRLINDTDLAYIRSNVGAGAHTISSVADSVRWMAWSYSSLDGLKQGRATSIPVGINLASACDDTINVATSKDCGNLTGTVTLASGGQSCSKIHSIVATELTNAHLTYEIYPDGQAGNWLVTVLNPSVASRSVIRVQTTSGRFVDVTQSKAADSIMAIPDSIDYGILPIGTEKCLDVELRNISKTVPTSIDEIVARNGSANFTYSLSGTIVQPGESVIATICFTPTDQRLINDTLIVKGSCFDLTTIQFIGRGGQPIMWAPDINFGFVPYDTPGVTRSGEVNNTGSTDLVITEIDSSLLEGVFHPVSGFDLPIVVPPGGTHNYQITFKPTGGMNESHSVRFVWHSNAAGIDSVSIWTAETIVSVDQDINDDALRLYPMPFTIGGAGGLHIAGLNGVGTVVIYDALGRPLHELSWEGAQAEVPSRVFAAAGTYFIVVTDADGRRTVPVICIE